MPSLTIFGDGFSDRVAQFADKIMDGVWEHFVCRKKDCSTVTAGADWISTVPEGYHFLCPKCGAQYKAQKRSETLWNANKVICIGLGASGASASREDAPGGSDGGPLDRVKRRRLGIDEAQSLHPSNRVDGETRNKREAQQAGGGEEAV